MSDELRGQLRTVEQGAGRVEGGLESALLRRGATSATAYSNAQLSDPPGASGWRPPLTLTVKARFSHPAPELRGTAGFGFWNAPFAPGSLALRPPRALWYFFGGPPHDVRLVPGVPGHGFKAQALDAGRASALLIAPWAPLALVAFHSPRLYRRLWPFAQWALGVGERSLAVGVADRLSSATANTPPSARDEATTVTADSSLDLTAWHTYALDWSARQAVFAVDGAIVLRAPSPPLGRLQLVLWIDNAYAIATPQGQFALGTVVAPAQWLEVKSLSVVAVS